MWIVSQDGKQICNTDNMRRISIYDKSIVFFDNVDLGGYEIGLYYSHEKAIAVRDKLLDTTINVITIPHMERNWPEEMMAMQHGFIQIPEQQINPISSVFYMPEDEDVTV